MAEAGIKISDLSNLHQSDIKTSDYTVLVHTGITCRAALSALQDAFGNTAGEDHANVQKLLLSANTLNAEVNVLSNEVKSIKNNIASADDLNALQNSYNEFKSDTETTLGNLTASVKSIDDNLSILINDPGMLCSLTSVVALLSGEDGKASLSNMANAIIDLSVKTLASIGNIAEISSALEILENRTNCELIDSVYTPFDKENNSIQYSNVADSTYDFYYDKNRFANVGGSVVSSYYSAMMSGVNANDEERTWTTTDVPSIEYILLHYNDPITGSEIASPGSPILEPLTYISIVSAEGYTINENNVKYAISSYYSTNGSDPNNPSITGYSDYGDIVPFPGEDTFNLNMIPIRAGMLVNGYKDLLGMELKISGNTDVDFYYANNAKIINGYKSKMNINIYGNPVARKASSSATTDDTDLNAVFHEVLRGGSTIEFIIDNELTNITNNETSSYSDLTSVNVDKYSLIAAICPKLLESEKQEFEINLISAWTIADTTLGTSETHITYRTTGGYSGDSYTINATYMNEEDTEEHIISFNGVPDSYTIDNAKLNINPIEVQNIAPNQTAIQNNAEINLYMIKKDDPTIKVKSSNSIYMKYFNIEN